jgi:hypothetical protein
MIADDFSAIRAGMRGGTVLDEALDASRPAPGLEFDLIKWRDMAAQYTLGYGTHFSLHATCGDPNGPHGDEDVLVGRWPLDAIPASVHIRPALLPLRRMRGFIS